VNVHTTYKRQAAMVTRLRFVSLVVFLHCCCYIADMLCVQRREIATTRDRRLSVAVSHVPADSQCNVSVAARLSSSILWSSDAYIVFETPPQGMVMYCVK